MELAASMSSSLGFPSDGAGSFGDLLSALSSYQRLFALTGPLYLVVSFVARLPLAMAQMGTMLLVFEYSGSYGAGGVAAGALAISNAVASPIAGGLADRYGQRPILVVQTMGGAVGLSVLVVLSQLEVGWPLLAVVSGAAGVFLPQVGALARVRWLGLTKSVGSQRPLLVSTAYSYEGAADEASFVLGPALVGTFVALVSPAGAIAMAAVLLASFGLWFGVHPTTSVVPGHRGVTQGAATRFGPILIGLAAGQFFVGMIFGSVQTGTTALATAAGNSGYAGLLHALLGVGSVIAGLLLAVAPARWALADRVPVFAGALAVMAAPLLWVNTLGMLAVALLVFGLAVAPYMITIFAACGQVTDPKRLGAAMMVLAAATSLGYATGSSTAGRIADFAGYTGAYAVTVGGWRGGLCPVFCAALRAAPSASARR